MHLQSGKRNNKCLGLAELPQTYLHVSWCMNVIANTTLRRWCSNDWLTDIFRVGRNIYECYYVWLDDIAWLSRILTTAHFFRVIVSKMFLMFYDNLLSVRMILVFPYRQIKATTTCIRRSYMRLTYNCQIKYDIGVGYVHQKRNVSFMVFFCFQLNDVKTKPKSN